ncbi:2-oxoglutarate (2OG) and Fe(II)-dependent oxygenase superfamily protein [Quillaja saponaria]|uniref:2-oxoglutarate (2OG) and Fe(II)-dependent oxygenase superfamily protein n=1 Tax=Quillaja saponaria TaxID=32244 RepID=A0AAD7LBJ2_QUISA|nr:2-oxoglutarate (2OG) and Fe(II)-dependent oxygenase superfamily protein [Quillaja saponaria]
MAPVPISLIKVGHIDDVQELRKAKPTTIPERFVRDRTERPVPATTLSQSSSIPIIDFSKLIKGNKEEFHNEILQLAAACEEWGFFQVINHGVDLNLLESIDKTAMEFFMLPLEEKQKYPMAPGTIQGYGQAFVFSEDQKLDWCNMFALGIEPQYIRNPKLWPKRPANFSETVELYSKEARKLCQNLLKYIAISLGLKGDVFEKLFGVAVQAIRMNYYPPCSRPDLVLGLSPHSDGSALTVLQQRKGYSVGLQILKDEKWVPVQPIPDALVINIGDSIEVLTNGKYKSVEHRAVTHKEKDRLSIVTFYAPSYDVEIGPMQELVDENNPCKYRRYNHGEYSKHYVTNKLQGKRTLDFAKTQASNSNKESPLSTPPWGNHN